jgi:hypothetical protein
MLKCLNKEILEATVDILVDKLEELEAAGKEDSMEYYKLSDLNEWLNDFIDSMEEAGKDEVCV